MMNVRVLRIGYEEMAKAFNTKKSNKTETPNVSKLLSKGMERYDKALEKLSKINYEKIKR